MFSFSNKSTELHSASKISDLNCYIIKPSQLEELKIILHKWETFLKGLNLADLNLSKCYLISEVQLSCHK
jgi:hypothetical protein